jgi:hypothetical protein
MWSLHLLNKDGESQIHDIAQLLFGQALRDTRTPDLVWPVDHHVPQQVWPYLMLRMFLAGVGFLVDRHQPHEAHQPPHPMITQPAVWKFGSGAITHPGIPI